MKYRPLVPNHGREHHIRLDSTSVNKKSWVSQKFIYLANRAEYKPNSLKQKGSIQFHYDKDLCMWKLKKG